MSVTYHRSIPSTMQANDHPYLNGAWTPLLEEVNASQLEVIGQIPHDIDGVYLRNTENQTVGASTGYFGALQNRSGHG
jgi:carotenoid cleavage dioxygenase